MKPKFAFLVGQGKMNLSSCTMCPRWVVQLRLKSGPCAFWCDVEVDTQTCASQTLMSSPMITSLINFGKLESQSKEGETETPP